MQETTLLALLALYAALLLGFVFLVARDPPSWGQGPRRMTVWIVVGAMVAGPIGILLVLGVARHQASQHALLLSMRRD